jgi:hypothetical protein
LPLKGGCTQRIPKSTVGSSSQFLEGRTEREHVVQVAYLHGGQKGFDAPKHLPAAMHRCRWQQAVF